VKRVINGKRAMSYQLSAISRIQDRGNLLPFRGVNKLTQSFGALTWSSTAVLQSLSLLTLLAAGCNQLHSTPAPQDERLQVKIEEAFRLSETDSWVFRTPGLWKVTGEPGRRYLELAKPPKRALMPGALRPQEYALYKPYEFRSFALSCFVRAGGQSSEPANGMCFILGRQDNTHLYSVCISDQRGDGLNIVVRVNGAKAASIAPANANAKPALPDRGWHKVDLLRDCDAGTIKLFIDARDEKTAHPYFELTDKTYEWGFVGVGTFNDAADFARILIEGEARKPAASPAIETMITSTEDAGGKR
jgi:hypothetical protein